MQELKRRLRFSRLGRTLRWARSTYQMWGWKRGRRFESPPPPVKVREIVNYAQEFGTRVFVETGAYLGDTIWAVRNHFDQLYSVELDPWLGAHVQARFARLPDVRILIGDSATVLPLVLQDVDESCLFWLDAHYSGGITARGDKPTPVMDELNAIANHFIQEHVVLIDDARLFNGEQGFPTVSELRSSLRGMRPGWHLEIRDDMVRVTPHRFGLA
jgi:hypothetical protein